MSDDQLIVVLCPACHHRYLKENATVLSETVVDGEVLDPDDDRERCPACGQTVASSPRVPVALDFDGGETSE